MSSPKEVVIVGAGPAGLTAAAELTENGHKVTVLEKDPKYVGGISRTVEHEGYRFDIGGHRFFSKSSEIMEWWAKRLPDDFIQVNRLSRVFYRKKFFDYPLKAMNALMGLGIFESVLCVLSYGWAKLFPRPNEKDYESWLTNRFGSRLFHHFFKTYTEKVWGTPVSQISADFAAQRIKGLSLFTAVKNAIFGGKGADGKIIKTLIDKFQYPRLGPGMMWEKTRDDIVKAGNEVLMGQNVIKIKRDGHTVKSIVTRDNAGAELEFEGKHFIASMPLLESVMAFEPALPDNVIQAAKRLQYRDFLTVALVVRKRDLFPDNWIYVHDPAVKLGRIQNFNNWSEEMIPDKRTTCLGLEYFCFEGDNLWNMSDHDLVELGKKEISYLGLIMYEDVVKGYVVRMEKAYPVYYPGYDNDVDIIRAEYQQFTNFQVAGRNGMHKYNNQDHAMMTAILAAKNIMGDKYNLWNVNTDGEYHEAGSDDTLNKGRMVPQKISS